MKRKDAGRESFEKLKRVTHQVICMRNISRLLGEHINKTHDVLYNLVHLIPEGWQYPNITCTRIKAGGYDVKSENFEETEWKQVVKIQSSTNRWGQIEVYYLEKKPELDDGPFLADERYLLETIASELGMFFEHKNTEAIKERQHKELNLYSSILRHDILNDIGVILGNIDILNEILNHDDETSEILTTIETLCVRMTGMLRIFTIKPNELETNITDIIQESRKTASNAYQKMVIKLHIEDDSKNLKTPFSRLLPFVFDNLFRNTAKYAGLDSHIEIHVQRKEDSICIRFSDNGPGIPKEVKEDLFEKGVSTSGGGLGLYLSRMILAIINGEIQLVDIKGNSGAIFEISLPLI